MSPVCHGQGQAQDVETCFDVSDAWRRTCAPVLQRVFIDTGSVGHVKDSDLLLVHLSEQATD